MPNMPLDTLGYQAARSPNPSQFRAAKANMATNQESPFIEAPRIVRILVIMGVLIALPVVFLVLQVRAAVALPAIAVVSIIATLFGGYWTMRTVHIARANARAWRR